MKRIIFILFILTATVIFSKEIIITNEPEFIEGMAIIRNENGKYGLINERGELVAKPKYDLIDAIQNGYAVCSINNKSGYIDRNGREIAVKYEDVFSFSDGMGGVQRIINGKYRYGFINEKGEEIIKTIYERIGRFEDGYANVKKGGKWGYIDKSGKNLTGFIYEEALSFQEGMANVKKMTTGDL